MTILCFKPVSIVYIIVELPLVFFCSQPFWKDSFICFCLYFEVFTATNIGKWSKIVLLMKILFRALINMAFLTILSIEAWNYRRTGSTYKKTTCYMRDSACRWCIVKKLKYFQVMLNIFKFSRVGGIVECWLVYANKFSWIAQQCFSTYIIKQS